MFFDMSFLKMAALYFVLGFVLLLVPMYLTTMLPTGFVAIATVLSGLSLAAAIVSILLHILEP